jgi:uncharacterized membrane protein
VVPSTGDWQTWTTISKGEIALSAGPHELTLVMEGGLFNVNWIRFVPPAVIPGLIEAEAYNAGGAGVGYHDATFGNAGGAYRADDVDLEASSEGGFNVGWIDAGEWLKYAVTVAAAGTYGVEVRIARAPTGTSAVHLEVDGVNVTGTMVVPSTGDWQTWTTISKGGIALSAGPHELTLVMEGGAFNVNWMRFVGGLTLSVVPAGTGSGTVTSMPAGITCRATCTASYSIVPVPSLTRTASVSVSSELTPTGQFGLKAVDGIVNGWPGDYTKECATRRPIGRGLDQAHVEQCRNGVPSHPS